MKIIHFMTRIVFLFFLLTPCVSLIAELNEPFLYDADILKDVPSSRSQLEREPVIRVVGSQSLSADQVETMVCHTYMDKLDSMGSWARKG